jgi:penicillin-binding protein 1C
MDGVSGVSGAGPLLHRAVLTTASRHAPGVLPTPAAAGAVPVTICRLSGLRATDRCPGTVEWFAPGTAPSRACDWHSEQGTTLPAEFAEWEQQQGPSVATAPPPGAAGRVSEGAFRILSPREGDVYRVPAGVEARYATVALRAAGGAAGRGIRWFVDGRPHAGGRWGLEPGPHRIRATDGAGESVEVGVAVER